MCSCHRQHHFPLTLHSLLTHPFHPALSLLYLFISFSCPSYTSLPPSLSPRPSISSFYTPSTLCFPPSLFIYPFTSLSLSGAPPCSPPVSIRLVAFTAAGPRLLSVSVYLSLSVSVCLSVSLSLWSYLKNVYRPLPHHYRGRHFRS
jgi:hypothetical protein